jgi:hypothetical protein
MRRRPVSSSVSEVLNVDVPARKDLRLMAVLPAHKVGRPPVLAEHLEDLGVALWLSLMVTPNNEAISRAGAQHGVFGGRVRQGGSKAP